MTIRIVLMILILGAALTGCGGRNDTSAATSADPQATTGSPHDQEEERVRVAYEKVWEASYDGKGETACSLYTRRYRTRVALEAARGPKAATLPSCEQVVAENAPLIRTVASRKIEIESVEVAGKHASAIVTASPGSSAKVTLVNIGGEWLVDSEEELEGTTFDLAP